jgi:hypothetical protein
LKENSSKTPPFQVVKLIPFSGSKNPAIRVALGLNVLHVLHRQLETAIDGIGKMVRQQLDFYCRRQARKQGGGAKVASSQH